MAQGSGDTVHDILDHYREGSTFDTPVPAENVPRLLEELEIQGVDDPDTGDDYLGVVVFLATHGADVPPVYRQRARAIALAMAEDEEYLRCWTNPRARQAELEKETDILGSKTAALHPDDYVSLLKSLPDSDSGPGMTDDEVRKMERYRRKKLVAWLDEIGIDDEMLKAWDAGDFWKRDEIYEEVRDMVKEDRRFQTHYRRTMRGPRPWTPTAPPQWTSPASCSKCGIRVQAFQPTNCSGSSKRSRSWTVLPPAPMEAQASGWPSRGSWFA